MQRMDILHQHLTLTPTNKNYRKSQFRFLAWALKHTVSTTTYSGEDMVNFLAALKAEHNFQPTMLKTFRAVVAHLHEDLMSIST
jgi:hypothetical protein